MRQLLIFLVISMIISSASAAFGPKKRETAFKRQGQTESVDALAAMLAAAYCTEEGCNPPPLAFSPSTNRDATEQQFPVAREEDDDFAIGYGTGVVACVVSLAMGFALGYSS